MGRARSDCTRPSQDGVHLTSIPFNCSHVVGNQALSEHKIREGLGHEATIYLPDLPTFGVEKLLVSGSMFSARLSRMLSIVLPTMARFSYSA